VIRAEDHSTNIGQVDCHMMEIVATEVARLARDKVLNGGRRTQVRQSVLQGLSHSATESALRFRLAFTDRAQRLCLERQFQSVDLSR